MREKENSPAICCRYTGITERDVREPNDHRIHTCHASAAQLKKL